MQAPVPHDVTEDASSRHKAARKIFYAHHLYSGAPHYECINAYTFHVEQLFCSSDIRPISFLEPKSASSGTKTVWNRKKSNVTVWRTGLSNPYSIYVEIKSRLKLGNHLEQNLFSSSSLYKNVKIEI